MDNSGSGKCTYFMWNGGFLQLQPKITYEHVYLMPYSIMNARLTTQVLSITVSKFLSNYGPADPARTVEF